MIFNKHLDLQGEHAFLGGSKYSWINYDEDKLDIAYIRYRAIQKGTELHAFACSCIQLNQKLPKTKKALNAFVNDAIGYRMRPEQVLFYSNNSFGTADAISYRDKILRIHDLKTGATPVVSLHQLQIYAALFCLEYGVRPTEISLELRIYQEENILVETTGPEVILSIMEKIILFDKRIDKFKSEDEQ